MAKHAGSRRGPRGPLRGRSGRALPGGVRAGAGALLAVAAVTVGAVVHGMGTSAAPAPAGDSLRQVAGNDTTALGAGRPGALRGKAPSATRGVDVSRQTNRPKTSPYRVHAGTTLSLRRAVVLAHKVADLSPAHSTFTIAQSNILGSQHTSRTGDKSGYASGTYRAGITASLLISRGVDVGGMQEVQADQLAVLRNRMPAYSFWPGTSLGHNGVRLQIYWRSDRFTMEKYGSVTYVFSSQHIPLPYVLLRDTQTGAEFWMITTHNSAGSMQGQRDAATSIEINLIRQLEATGLPVIITGDMNEHTEFFCRVAPATGMVAANGGSGVGGCHLPPAPLRVDWIMGRGVDFSGYRQDGAGLGRASDHYYLYSQVSTTSRWYAPGDSP